MLCSGPHRAVFIEPRAPGENRSWGPSFPFFCLKTRFFFQKKILKKSLFFLRRSSFVEAPSASDPWQPPGSPGGKDGPGPTQNVMFLISKIHNVHAVLWKKNVLFYYWRMIYWRKREETRNWTWEAFLFGAGKNCKPTNSLRGRFRYFRFSQFVIHPHFLLVISDDQSVATQVTQSRPSNGHRAGRKLAQLYLSTNTT